MRHSPTPSLFAPVRGAHSISALLGLTLLSTLALGCASTPPRLAHRSMESRAMRVEMNYAVYTPPGFSPTERLPLVIFLHGGGDDYASFDRWGIGPRLDAAIAEGRVPRAVIALPDGHLGMWANWADGSRRYADWVLEEVLPAVQRDYHTRSCPEDCHVMGVSMGGNGALRMMLAHPETFASVGVLSAPIFTTDEMLEMASGHGGGIMRLILPVRRVFGDPPRWRVEEEDPFLRWTEPADVAGKTLFLAWAEDDRGGIVAASERFHEHLEEAGIEHAAEQFRGGHNWVSWAPVIERALAHNLEPDAATRAGDGG